MPVQGIGWVSGEQPGLFCGTGLLILPTGASLRLLFSIRATSADMPVSQQWLRVIITLCGWNIRYSEMVVDNGVTQHSSHIGILLQINILFVFRLPGFLRFVELNRIVDMAQHGRHTILVLDIKPQKRHHTEIINQLCNRAI